VRTVSYPLFGKKESLASGLSNTCEAPWLILNHRDLWPRTIVLLRLKSSMAVIAIPKCLGGDRDDDDGDDKR
jgi:hypothetical protein